MTFFSNLFIALIFFSFSFYSLRYNTERTATVVAAQDAKLWAMDRLDFKRILLKSPESKIHEYETFLRNIPLLNSLLHEERKKVTSYLLNPQNKYHRKI